MINWLLQIVGGDPIPRPETPFKRVDWTLSCGLRLIMWLVVSKSVAEAGVSE